jgi:hypothetical protein
MINIFENSIKLINKLKSSERNYWEDSSVEWDKAAKAPDGSTFNEEAMMESIRQSDINRLIKFG